MILRREMHPSSALRFKRREGQGFILLGIALHKLLRLGAGNDLAAVFELRALQGQGIETLGVVLHAAAVKNAFDGQKQLRRSRHGLHQLFHAPEAAASQIDDIVCGIHIGDLLVGPVKSRSVHVCFLSALFLRHSLLPDSAAAEQRRNQSEW